MECLSKLGAAALGCSLVLLGPADAKAPRKGDLAPDFRLHLFLAAVSYPEQIDLRGRVVLIDFSVMGETSASRRLRESRGSGRNSRDPIPRPSALMSGTVRPDSLNGIFSVAPLSPSRC